MLYYLDGPGGTGKTFLYKALYYRLISEGKKVVMVAHTGIAATLLINGSTVHRQFSVPLDLGENIPSPVDRNSDRGKEIIETDVIIWDEATMSDRRVYACVDRLLRDLMNTSKPFGGKVVLLGGDWRQHLPVIRTSYDSTVTKYTLKLDAKLWPLFAQLKLARNMRAEDPDGAYAKFLRRLGERKHRRADQDEFHSAMPPEVCVETEEEAIDFVYGGGALEDIGQVKDVCILSTQNKDTMEINERVLEMKKGEAVTFKSIYSAMEEFKNMALPQQFYHTQTPTGMPPHELKLKEGCIVILLRNIDVSLGLCNGTRLRVDKIRKDQNVLVCTRLTSEKTPDYGTPGYEERDVILTRLPMQPADKSDPSLRFTRMQFPIRLAYSLTINKAQGQTLRKVALLLRKPPFAHGQLYVALSRVSSFDGLRVSQKDSKRNERNQLDVQIRNVVYPDVLK